MLRNNKWLLLGVVALVLMMGAYVIFTKPVDDKSTIVAMAKGIPTTPPPTQPALRVNAKPPVKTETANQIATNKFLNAKDLNAFISGLQNNPSKKAEYAVAKAKAIGECAAFGRQPTHATDMARMVKSAGKGNPQIIDRYASESTQRCAAFAASGPMTRADATNLYVEAAQAGNPEAAAHQIQQQLLFSQNAPIDELRTKAVDLINSGDPGAVFELSNAFGVNSKFSGAGAGTEKATAAWQLAACDMGLDCSQDSALLAAFCLNGGMYCDGGDLRFNMQNSQFSPSDFAEVTALEDAINTQRSTGNTSSLFH